MSLINHSVINYSVEGTEADIRKALIAEVLERHGLMDGGKPIPGVATNVTYNGRHRGDGAYTVHIRRDISKSGQAQLPKPEGKA